MEGFAFGLGVLLAIFGPILLIPLTWIVYRIGTKRLASGWLARRPRRRR